MAAVDSVIPKMQKTMPDESVEDINKILLKMLDEDTNSYVGINEKEERKIMRCAAIAISRGYRCPKKYFYIDPEGNIKYGGYINSFTISVSENGKKTSPKPAATATSIKTSVLLKDISYDVNYYMTVNPVRKPGKLGRKVVHSYRNIVVDMDLHDIPIEIANHIAVSAAKTLVSEVNKGEFEGYEPCSIVMTGRGVQLMWSLDPMPGKLGISYIHYRENALALCNLMKNWLTKHPEFALFEIDHGASINPGGLVRMPGTCNIKVAKEIGVEYAIARAYIPIRYIVHKAEELYDNLAEFWPEEKNVIPAKAKKINIKKFIAEHGDEEPEENPEKETNPYVLSREENKRRYYNVLGLIKNFCAKKTDPSGDNWYIPEGKRDLVLFVLGNLAMKFMSVRKMLELMIELNHKHFYPSFPDSFIESYLSTSLHTHNDDRSLGYTFSDSYITRVLSIAHKKIPFYRSFESIKKIREKEKAEHMKERNAKYQEAARLYDSGLSYQKIAEMMNRTRQTISRWVKLAKSELNNNVSDNIDKSGSDCDDVVNVDPFGPDCDDYDNADPFGPNSNNVVNIDPFGPDCDDYDNADPFGPDCDDYDNADPFGPEYDDYTYVSLNTDSDDIADETLRSIPDNVGLLGNFINNDFFDYENKTNSIELPDYISF